MFARLATAGIATLPLIALERVYLADVWDLVNGAGEKGAGEGIAREIRALMPASAKLFRTSLECSYENEPDDAVLVDPKYISQVWRWRDDAGERMLLQTICYLGAAGRGVSGNLFVLQPNAVSKATNLIGGDAIEGMNLTDDVAACVPSASPSGRSRSRSGCNPGSSSSIRLPAARSAPISH